MNFHSTASHAINLFYLTMERRYGKCWRRDCAPQVIADAAAELARGYGGTALTPEISNKASDIPVIWQLPDGSQIRTGRFGLQEERINDSVA